MFGVVDNAIDWSYFPVVTRREKNAISKVISTRVHEMEERAGAGVKKNDFPLYSFRYTNPSESTIINPNPNYADTTVQWADPNEIVIFVFEARDKTAICGKWPCLGFHKDQWTVVSGLYQMDPNRKEDNPPKPGDEIRKAEEEFWKLCPRKEFEEKWPELEEAIEEQYQKRVEEEQKKQRQLDDRKKRKKAAAAEAAEVAEAADAIGADEKA
ncbi:hypothetical protein BDP27DRAFT_1323487 [Rhodocollybia butyracea]|uniref:Uncharacterized protein n=1 Tax=Rhodocollybia butyracea TaxID=206335 RepID=A0A9P5U844_9AGAR|nr:hypothetical protein BDP27DRAFT_1323487 [Rhodocollybia butyracea]